MYPVIDILLVSSYADFMHVRTPRELGAAIRGQRRRLGLTQAELACAVGVTRAWIIAIEQGKRSAELGLVMKTVAALGLVVDITNTPVAHSGIDLDDLLDNGVG